MGENDTQAPYPTVLETIDAAYARYTGQGLGARECPAEVAQGGREARLAWVNNAAPFGVLAHNTDSDPKFIYANNGAVEMFGYGRDEFIGLPSRLSASPDRRPARAAFLETARTHGFADGYSDIRVDRSGNSFRIRDGAVWQIHDDSGVVIGQAALIWFDGKVD